MGFEPVKADTYECILHLGSFLHFQFLQGEKVKNCLSTIFCARQTSKLEGRSTPLQVSKALTFNHLKIWASPNLSIHLLLVLLNKYCNFTDKLMGYKLTTSGRRVPFHDR